MSCGVFQFRGSVGFSRGFPLDRQVDEGLTGRPVRHHVSALDPVDGGLPSTNGVADGCLGHPKGNEDRNGF